MPKRIQMSRQHPWRAEHPDAVIVDRRTKWGNPYRVGESLTLFVGKDRVQRLEWIGPATAVALYRLLWLTNWNVADARIPHAAPGALAELAGRDLACWCPLDQPCHADVLLAIANEGVA